MEESTIKIDESIKYESFEAFLNRVGKEAETNGLTQEILNTLLGEE